MAAGFYAEQFSRRRCCRTVKTLDDAAPAAALAQTVCLGNISALGGKGSVLRWDGHCVTNNAVADKNVTMAYRNGWDPFNEA